MTKRRGTKKMQPSVGFRFLEENGASPASKTLELGQRQVEVFPMTVGSFSAAVRLFEPYLSDVSTAVLRQYSLTALADKEQAQKAFAQVLSNKLTKMAVDVPELFVRLVACLMNIIPERDAAILVWFDSAVTPTEMFTALQELDSLNDFAKLYTQAVAIWAHFSEKYGLDKLFEAVAKEQVEEPILEER